MAGGPESRPLIKDDPAALNLIKRMHRSYSHMGERREQGIVSTSATIIGPELSSTPSITLVELPLARTG